MPLSGNRVGFGMPLACPVRGDLGSADCPILPVEGIGLNVIQTSKTGGLADTTRTESGSLPAGKELGKHSSEVPRRGLLCERLTICASC